MSVEFIIYSTKGGMLFSDTFIPEWALYLVVGTLYLFYAYRIGRSSYLRTAILGLCIGFVVFTVIGYQLFLHFEFANNLSL
jgi:hypothetical protein